MKVKGYDDRKNPIWVDDDFKELDVEIKGSEKVDKIKPKKKKK